MNFTMIHNLQRNSMNNAVQKWYKEDGERPNRSKMAVHYINPSNAFTTQIKQQQNKLAHTTKTWPKINKLISQSCLAIIDLN